MVLPLALIVGLIGAGTVAAGTTAAYVAKRIKANRARANIRALRASGYITPQPRYYSNAYITDDQIYMLGNSQTRVPMRKWSRRKMNNLRGYRATSYWDLERYIK
jgi:hypothetical protein